MEISVKDWWNTEQKGGPGSGNWEGPGDPRYVHEGNKDPKDFSWQDLRGKDFSGQDLRGYNFTGANLTNANLINANLTGADLTGAKLIDAYLTDANLTGANLTNANLRNAKLPGANLTNANLRNAKLTGADLTGAKLIDAYLTDANLTGAKLIDADLTGANLTNANLTRANLTGVYLTGANLTNANLTNANLINANLTGADLTGANLTNANLTNANLRNVNLTGADLTGAKLPGANLTNANLRNVNLTGADLIGAKLIDADLTGANLTDVWLTDANLTGANLTNANLRNAKLTGANLTNANLRNAKLTGVYLTGVYLTGITLPNGNKITPELISALDINKIINKDFQSHSSQNNKIFVQDSIVKATGIDKDKVRDNIDQWAGTSGDNSSISIANQLVAKEIFKLDSVKVDHWPKDKLKEASELIDSNRKAILQAQYDLTQKYFKDKGVKEVLVYRGVGDSYKGGPSVDLQPISSFSLDYGVARNFGHNVFAAKISVEKILSHPRTGFGCTTEQEITVLGSKLNVVKVKNLLEANELYIKKKEIGLGMFFKGGPGSGNYGHEGRPGQIGGSDDIVSTMTTRYNKLHISDAGASIVTKHLRDLSKFPDNILNTLSDKGVSIYVGSTGVTQLDGNAYLSGKTPVGYPSGRTWDSVAGSYFPSTKIVSVGEGENSSASVMDHEIGHAIYREILVKAPDLLQRYDEIYNTYNYTLNPFFNNAAIGKSEFFAESVALQMTGELEKNGYDSVFWQYRMLDDNEEQIFVDKMQNLLIDIGVVRASISVVAEGNIE